MMYPMPQNQRGNQQVQQAPPQVQPLQILQVSQPPLKHPQPPIRIQQIQQQEKIQVHHQQQQNKKLKQREVKEELQETKEEQDCKEKEEGEDQENQKAKNRTLFKRFYNYVREAWTGVKSALDSELEDLETPPRYRPDSLEALCRATRFTQAEIKRIYRGFKAECPTGVVKEETFKMIYAQFFPQGANTSQYAHYVFNTLDQDHSGLISFEDFVQNLSVLSRGSLDEKLRWTFNLYDINGDGYITREEMTDIVSAVYDLMGKLAEPCIDDDTVKEKVERIFQKMDKNQDGVVSFEEFLDCCQKDQDISTSMTVFDSSI
ncbi:A-type potassium channel modulatory protein KCNIP1 isoform X1 [Onthophagus taurus]|uniref:A-type potassium channel modulatory protein KCNIP1 isoform X1 n=1 Tax=Onthophagus taurus TaxID=166361 RepID=UPI000C202AAC|nr:Kv channel-interacting protein 1 isoform X1 [Onthophagus taurus]XP_022919779.1 Kv channel-interacting protein 1 isoform X1 [Onthophagus taurus]XP_022919781.1 Kv channel-interacting protein 1 isoform X1 [Onthophagus taurus]XP_022919782.1 Kv channel-interacting protein 1 isoform X1 [Onthophagus taurus]